MSKCTVCMRVHKARPFSSRNLPTDQSNQTRWRRPPGEGHPGRGPLCSHRRHLHPHPLNPPTQLTQPSLRVLPVRAINSVQTMMRGMTRASGRRGGARRHGGGLERRHVTRVSATATTCARRRERATRNTQHAGHRGRVRTYASWMASRFASGTWRTQSRGTSRPTH
jgi:hypothetical protein